jgi:hypothetical protein
MNVTRDINTKPPPQAFISKSEIWNQPYARTHNVDNMRAFEKRLVSG